MLFRSFWPSIIWSLVILSLSFMSGKSIPSADWMDWFKLDKWIHTFLYFTLLLLIYFPINFRRANTFIYLGIGYCLLLGVFTEVVQGVFLVDRTGDIDDMVANALGVLLALILIRFLTKKWPWKVLNE